MNRRRALATVLLATALLAATVSLQGCSDEQQPHALTETDAQRLAVMRFNNYQDGLVTLRGKVPSGAGDLALDGRLDFSRAIGYATLRTQGRDDPGSSGVIQWTPSTVAMLVGARQTIDPPPATGWQVRPLQRAGGELDTTLALLLGLAADRPDNALLLRQSSARWLRTENLNGVEVDVYDGPGRRDARGAEQPRVRYWINRDDRLRRVEARIGTSAETVEIDLTSGAEPFQPITALAS